MNGYYTDKFINLILQNKNKLSSKEFIEQKKIEMLFKISGKSVINQRKQIWNMLHTSNAADFIITVGKLKF